MAMLAMWLQETYTFSSGSAKLLMIFVGLAAVSMVVQAIALIALAVRTSGTAKDLSEMAEELKDKLLPLIATATEVGRTSQALISETAPKVKRITDNLVRTSDTLVETSNMVRESAQHFDQTLADVNVRAQRQVARIDGMVASALNTTSEIVETIDSGIRGSAQKIAGMATQMRYGLEGLLARVKGKSAGPPSGNG